MANLGNISRAASANKGLTGKAALAARQISIKPSVSPLSTSGAQNAAASKISPAPVEKMTFGKPTVNRSLVPNSPGGGSYSASSFSPVGGSKISNGSGGSVISPNTFKSSSSNAQLKGANPASVITTDEKKKKLEAQKKGITDLATNGGSFIAWKSKNPNGSYQDWQTQRNKPNTSASPALPTTLPTLPDQNAANAANLTNPDINSQLSAIQNEYLSSLAPSSEEQAAQANLDQEQSALNQGLTNVQDQPIALPFITGQSASLERRSLARQQPLSQQLARLQGMRQSAGQIASAKLGFANQSLDRQATQQKNKDDAEAKKFDQNLTLATKGLRYDPKTGQFTKDPNLASVALSPQDAANLEQGLRKEYIDQAKTFQTVRDSYGRMMSVAKDPSPAGDIALVFSFMKILDPTSVVREGEFATAANAGSVPTGIINWYNKVVNGERLGANRQDFINQGTNIYKNQVQQHQQSINQYTQLAKSAGVNPSNVVIDLGLAGGTSGGNTVKVLGPDGKTYQMTPDKAKIAVSQGGKIIQ